jgi:hypothetical protein
MYSTLKQKEGNAMLRDDIRDLAQKFSGKLEEKKGVFTLTVTVAERRGFLRKDRLEYVARFRIDDNTKALHFSEMLKERGSGISSGEGIQGFGVEKEVTRVTSSLRSGTIEEQSNLFGARYEYRFDYGAIRKAFTDIAERHGFRFEYHTSFGNI